MKTKLTFLAPTGLRTHALVEINDRYWFESPNPRHLNARLVSLNMPRLGWQRTFALFYFHRSFSIFVSESPKYSKADFEKAELAALWAVRPEGGE